MSVYTARAIMIKMMMIIIIIIIIINLILTSWNVVLHRGEQSRKKHEPTPIYETHVFTGIINNVFRPQKTLEKTRIKLYNTLALSVLLYGSET